MKRVALRTFATTGVVWVLLMVTPIVPWWAQWLSAGYSDAEPSVLVVLAGDSAGQDVLGYSTYLRCVYAFWFWQRHHSQQILLSGGPPDRPIAQDMANFLVSLGVPRAQLRLETRSTTTRENLEQVALLLNRRSGSLTLLTSDYHMRRSLRLARRAGLSMAPYPVPDVGKQAAFSMWQRPGLAGMLLVETGKLSLETLHDLF